MTISSNIRKAGPFVGNGTASTFAFTFKVFQAADLEVVRLNVATTIETILVINSNYTVSLNADQNSNPGGSITLTAGALASGFNLVITSDIENLQPTDIVNQGGFYPDVIEDALDRATIQIQQLQEAVDRSAKLPITSSADADALVADIIALADDQANIDIVATNITSVNTAATNIAAIIAAPTQATNAAASALAASGSASAAAASESAAAASAAAAAASLDNFDDRYLGAKSSDPTVDNDGNPLVVGALYYRTTTPIGMKVYDGSQWLEASAAQQAALITYEYVATAGQTTFTGPDANALTLSYIAGSIIVALNGVLLRPGDDYTATNGTSVVLSVAASLNDELKVCAFSSFLLANAVAKTGDTMTGSLNFSGNGIRITGEFSTATFANRVAFQSSVANGNTTITALPNGTATTGVLEAYNASDPTNSQFAHIQINATDARIQSGARGTGTSSYLPMTFYTGGSEAMRLATTGRLTTNKAANGTLVTLTDGATITPDFDASNHFQVTLGGNRTLANPTNVVAGQSGVIRVVQDGTGSRTLAYGSNFKFSNGIAPVLTTTANAVDLLVYFVESSSRIAARLVSDVK